MFENKPAVANFKCSDQELCVEQVGKDEGCNVQQGYLRLITRTAVWEIFNCIWVYIIQ